MQQTFWQVFSAIIAWLNVIKRDVKEGLLSNLLQGGEGVRICFVKQISQVNVMANIQLLHSAVIEHTNRVIYMEDDDVAAVVNGSK